MIYTLGRVETYYKSFRGNYPLPTYKVGRHFEPEYYPGGSVWQTREAAQVFADKQPGYSVFTVDANWETDTEPSADGDWHDLLRDAVILESLAVIPDLDEEFAGGDA